MFARLDESSKPVVGPAVARLLVIPIHDDTGAVAGGFWGITLFRWLHVQMLIVPEILRGRGIGSAVMNAAETEARARGCIGSCVDTFSFQATGFYEKLGYIPFGVLEDYPPGHQRIYFTKRLSPS
jgi:GNAT superfamily N-acetyltransferase